MLPDPLHPAVVHFPIVLTFLLPIVALVALWAIRRGTAPRRAWAIPLVVSAALAVSSWVAVETGESQGEKVERVVPERAFDSHEEGGEQFLALSGALVLVVAVGLASGIVGRSARVVATAGALALIVAAARVGHTGGQLVYRYGAARAYTGGDTLSTEAPNRGARAPTEREGHER